MIKLITPFENVSKTTRTIILVGWIVLLLILWFVITSGEKHLFPSPDQVLKGFEELYKEGLVVHIFNSLKLCFISILLAVILSMLFAYSFPLPLLKPISEFITKLRFLPFTGLSFYITMVVHDARNMQIWIMVIFLTTFLTTSLISVINAIPQEEFDHAKSLKCSRFEVLWQVIVLGRIDYVIDVIRQNLAITWMMLVTVESIVVASGGLGFLIKNSDKFMNHGRIIALQIIILLIGLFLDWFINYLRKAIFRYSKI
ncbi:ABC transporter permease [Chryseobacterium shigense]|uniref:NitT/TauT family transport system permease protein n=1 Tax=Chryseobacterium shigense TaxID=297244 RepID=A0A841N775_9FLAO|nr:ABC transporter permease subunit [Chryseobacterium shigense]MBB6369328.1 NitT/TauT family transport system permease protein [Chryseobacterium shigense]